MTTLDDIRKKMINTMSIEQLDLFAKFITEYNKDILKSIKNKVS